MKSPRWGALLKTRGWADPYLSGEAFDSQLKTDIDATSAILKDIGLVK